jgi:anthranilate phosphoribosyltransferase
MNASIFGLPICPAIELTGGTPKENAYITMTVLDGGPGSKRDAVILNAALAIMAYDPESTPKSAVLTAASSLDSGSAKEVLIRLQQLFPGEGV